MTDDGASSLHATRREARKITTALAITTTSAAGVLTFAVSVMIGPMNMDLGWSTATLSAGPTLGLVVSGLWAPKVGRTIDRHGGRAVMVFGALLGGLGVAVWSAATSIGVFLLAWAIIGVGMSMTQYPPAFAIVVRHTPLWTRQGVMTVTLAGALASTIFIPLADLLVGVGGWRVALLWLAFGHVVVATPLCLALIPGRNRIPPAWSAVGDTRRGADERHDASTADRDGDASFGAPAARADAPRLLSSPPLRRTTLAQVLGRSATVAVGVHVVVFLVATGRSPSQAAAVAALLGIAKVLGRLAVGIAARRWSSRRLLASCYAIMGLGLLLPLVAPPGPYEVVMAAAMVVAFGVASGGSTVLQPLFVAEQFGSTVFGVTSGRITRVDKVGSAFAPLAVGGMVTLTASHTWAWSLLAVGCILASLVLPKLVRAPADGPGTGFGA